MISGSIIFHVKFCDNCKHNFKGNCLHFLHLAGSDLKAVEKFYFAQCSLGMLCPSLPKSMIPSPKSIDRIEGHGIYWSGILANSTSQMRPFAWISYALFSNIFLIDGPLKTSSHHCFSVSHRYVIFISFPLCLSRL